MHIIRNDIEVYEAALNQIPAIKSCENPPIKINNLTAPVTIFNNSTEDSKENIEDKPNKKSCSIM